MSGNKRALLVLGNGKSLENYPFQDYQVDTIGMSQAYRYWDQIGWYPTYYCCLDKNVNVHFANDILRLIRNRKQYGIKKFLLSQRILTQFPGLRNNPDIYFSENLNQPGKKGFSGDTQVTTGSYSVRFGIFLGYQKIYILGIDAHYRPINISWVRSITDSRQMLKVTVDPEPDYFFIGYRAKGDYFHLPPKRRWKNRYNHLQTFKKIHAQFNLGKNKKVFICDPLSKLKTAKILPYIKLPEIFLGENEPTVLKLPLRVVSNETILAERSLLVNSRNPPKQMKTATKTTSPPNKLELEKDLDEPKKKSKKNKVKISTGGRSQKKKNKTKLKWLDFLKPKINKKKKKKNQRIINKKFKKKTKKKK